MREHFQDQWKYFWKEIMGLRKGASKKEERVEEVDGRLLMERKAGERRWAEYSEGLLSVDEDKETEVVISGRRNGVRRLKGRNGTHIRR